MILAMPASTEASDCDVEFDGAQVDAVLRGEAADVGDLRRVAALRLAHPGVDGVAGLGEGAGGQRAEAARSAGDDDDLLVHDLVPSTNWSCLS